MHREGVPGIQENPLEILVAIELKPRATVAISYQYCVTVVLITCSQQNKCQLKGHGTYFACDYSLHYSQNKQFANVT